MGGYCFDLICLLYFFKVVGCFYFGWDVAVFVSFLVFCSFVYVGFAGSFVGLDLV